MKKSIYILGMACMLGLTGCYDLDKTPEGTLSSVTAFKTVKEMSKYLNQFYENGLMTQPGNVDGGGIAFGDNESDNMIPNSVNVRLNGASSLSNASKLTGYNQIRNLNFLIQNIKNCEETGPELNQCIGEAYYFRAWFYYQMFIDYGELTWLGDEILDPDQEQMKRKRDSRTFIADKILADLDTAIENLQEQNSNATMRVHRDVARILKAEVALFEGTWEKYHKQKNTPFFDKTVTDEKIADYLNQAVNAVDPLINGDRKGVWKIYSTGNETTDYRDMFIDLDLTDNQEVLWWKKYDAADNIGHSVTRFLNQGGGRTGASASFVDDCLTKEGKPYIGDEKMNGKRKYGNELNPEIRDPRLSQVVCMPGQELRPNGKFTFKLPPLNGESYNQNSTGYSILKYVEFNTEFEPTIDGEFKSQAPAIQYRYADALLIYAEALAELDGEKNSDKIKNALKPLRDRVGMPGVDFDREYNTEPDYPFKDLNKYIQAVRRERRIEKAFEGKRLFDILRWAAADVLIKGKTPTGALFVGSDLENNPFYNNELVYDKESGNNLFLTGSPNDTERYIIPFNPSSAPNGWNFNLDRDYLLPIQERMINLTGGLWTNNPGW